MKVAWRRLRRRRVRLALLAAVLVAGLVMWLWPGPNLRTGSERSDGDVVVASRVLDAYRITYLAETHGGGQLTLATDVLEVVRPFNGMVRTFSGPPPGDAELSLTINALTRLQTSGAVFGVEVGPPPIDRRPDTALDEVIEAGRAEARERRQVIGRPCQIYRLNGLAGVRGLGRVDDITDEYSEVCIDEAGLVLEEVAFSDGKLLTRRVAVEVDESPDIDPDAYHLGEPTLDVNEGGGSVQPLTPTSRTPDRFWELREPLAGFEHAGRFAIVPPQGGFGSPFAQATIVATVTDGWIDGIDMIAIERGGSLQGTEPFVSDPNADEVDLGQLGTGELRYGLGSSELRVDVGGGRWLRLVGTVAPSRLVATARSLEEVPGGRLTVVDGG